MSFVTQVFIIDRSSDRKSAYTIVIIGYIVVIRERKKKKKEKEKKEVVGEVVDENK